MGYLGFWVFGGFGVFRGVGVCLWPSGLWFGVSGLGGFFRVKSCGSWVWLSLGVLVFEVLNGVGLQSVGV